MALPILPVFLDPIGPDLKHVENRLLNGSAAYPWGRLAARGALVAGVARFAGLGAAKSRTGFLLVAAAAAGAYFLYDANGIYKDL